MNAFYINAVDMSRQCTPLAAAKLLTFDPGHGICDWDRMLQFPLWGN